MGSWGAASFENDDALDWLSEASTFTEWTEISELLNSVDERLATPSSCSELVAACELIAARNGHPDTELPSEAFGLISSLALPTPELCSQATAALDQIVKKSALRDLWRESGELTQWRGQVVKLKKRLTLPTKAIALNPGKAPTIDELGKQAHRQMMQNRWAHAIKTLDKILSIDSQRVVTHNNKAWSLANMGQFELAQEEIEKTFELLSRLSTVPDLTRAACFGTRAFIYLKTARYEEALADLNTSLGLNARTINFKHRGEVLEKLGKVDQAARDFETFKAMTINDHLKQARRFWNDTQYQAAKAELSLALELEPKHILALARRAFANSQIQSLEEADADFSTWMETYGENPYLLFERAQERSQLKREIDARRDRERCHQLGVDMIAFYDSFVKRQDEIIEGGNLERIKKAAIPNLNKILKVVPEHPLARSLKVKALRATDAVSQAAREEARALKPLPNVDLRTDMLGWGEWFWKLMTNDEEEATKLLLAWANKS